jgi:putative oxidoreductase
MCSKPDTYQADEQPNMLVSIENTAAPPQAHAKLPPQKEQAMSDRGSMQSSAVALLRIVAGAMFACHGAQKILHWPPPGLDVPMWGQLWFGGIIELSCGVLIAIGLFTRLAAFLASGTMAVAYFQFQWQIHEPGALANLKFVPVVNKGELAVLYCFVFLVFAMCGPGPFSIDNRRRM